MGFFSNFLQNSSGESSSMRAVMWFFSAIIGFVWVYACIFGKDGPAVLPLPDEVVNLIAYVVGAKVLQATTAESGLAGAIKDKIMKKEP